MNVVAYGGGTNSTAMLIGMRQHEITVDLILFADTGGERPETYEYIRAFGSWLAANGMPPITVLEYADEDGNRMTLEQECLKSCTLPSIAYGYKRCSLKHKKGVQDKYCNNHPECKEVWESGGKVNRYIGYDADEPERRDHAIVYDMVDKKYKNHYPLIDLWGWGRDECIGAILREGLPLPGKSSCFFCPSMKVKEVRDLYKQHPDMFARAIAIEDNARAGLTKVAGLGRNWSWRDYITLEEKQVTLFSDDIGVPCNCYDG